MITTPTVLVLGAGASQPYGFPSAGELADLICKTFTSENSDGCRFFDSQANLTAGDFLRFREALLKSDSASVDAFLEYRQEFMSIGKLAIAYCLMPFEKEEKLFQCDGARGEHWYKHLSGKLSASFDKFGDNKLSIITFNYDRSLEHYLLTTLANMHGKNWKDCADTIAKIPIVHVYGQLSATPYPASGSRSGRDARHSLQSGLQ
jgi:hypothetical protein